MTAPGTSPFRIMRSLFCLPDKMGMAESNALVYGWRGLAKSSFLFATKTAVQAGFCLRLVMHQCLFSEHSTRAWPNCGTMNRRSPIKRSQGSVPTVQERLRPPAKRAAVFITEQQACPLLCVLDPVGVPVSGIPQHIGLDTVFEYGLYLASDFRGAVLDTH